MVRMRAAPSPIRFAWATLFALLLALRSLAPAGFMPAFDHGSVTIVLCPDAGLVQGMHHHHPGDHKSSHDPCPYASVSSLGALGVDFAPIIAVILLAVALLLGRTFLFLESQSRRDRPTATGPPLSA